MLSMKAWSDGPRARRFVALEAACWVCKCSPFFAGYPDFHRLPIWACAFFGSPAWLGPVSSPWDDLQVAGDGGD